MLASLPPLSSIYTSPIFRFFLVFEMMRGGALFNHIQKHKRFTEREAAIVVERVASALKHLHGQGRGHHRCLFSSFRERDGAPVMCFD